MAMTKERLEEAKLWMEWVSEQDTPRNHSAEMGCVYSSMAMLIAEVERLQVIEASASWLAKSLTVVDKLPEKEWPIPFKEEEIKEAKDVVTSLWSMGPSVQGPLVRVIAKLEQLLEERERWKTQVLILEEHRTKTDELVVALEHEIEGLKRS